MDNDDVDEEEDSDTCADDTCAPMFPYILDSMVGDEMVKFSGLVGEKAKQTTALAHYRLLGNSGLRVSPCLFPRSLSSSLFQSSCHLLMCVHAVCLGTLAFGDNWGAMMTPMTKEQVETILDKYVEKGGNFVDTALNYQDGQSVEWLGEWMKKKACRDRLVIAAKYSMPLHNGDINSGGNHRKSLRYALKETLRALRTDYIVCRSPLSIHAPHVALTAAAAQQDILYVHLWDFVTPVEETMRALDDVVRAGQVHYLGVSDTPAWVVAQANTLARARGWAPFVAFQGKYNPSEREAELDLLPMCRALGLGYIPWGLQPWCARLGSASAASAQKEGDAGLGAVVGAVAEVAAQQGCTPAQAVFAWALHKDPVVSVLLTCHSVAVLDEYIGALGVRLTPEQAAALERAAPLVPRYPHKYIGYTYQTSRWFEKAGTIAMPGDTLY